MNILIGTPAYGGKLDLDFLNSIIDCTRAKLPITVIGLRNESLIPRARNTIFTYFLYLKQFTHLLFIDADIGISAEDIIRLMSHDKDCIGAPVRLKGTDKNNNPVYNVYPPFNIKNGINMLQQVDKVGTAVFCLSRFACEKLAEDAPRYSAGNLTRGDAMDVGLHYDVFRCGMKGDEYLSEDYWVCKSLNELGIPVWVDWSIKTRHWGTDVYE